MKTKKNWLKRIGIFILKYVIAPTIVAIISGIALFKINDLKKDINTLNVIIQQQNTTIIDTLTATIQQINNFQQQNAEIEIKDSAKVDMINQQSGSGGTQTNTYKK